MYRVLSLITLFLLSTSVFGSHHGGGQHKSSDGLTHFESHGLVKYKSAHSVFATVDKLVERLEAKNMTIFNRIDHAAGAKKVNLELRPTQLIIFGNPKVGTKLMQCSQTTAIDLPLKMLIWEDAQGDVWLGYHRPKHLAKKHRLDNCGEVLKKVSGAMKMFAEYATTK